MDGITELGFSFDFFTFKKPTRELLEKASLCNRVKIEDFVLPIQKFSRKKEKFITIKLSFPFLPKFHFFPFLSPFFSQPDFSSIKFPINAQKGNFLI